MERTPEKVEKGRDKRAEKDMVGWKKEGRDKKGNGRGRKGEEDRKRNVPPKFCKMNTPTDWPLKDHFRSSTFKAA